MQLRLLRFASRPVPDGRDPATVAVDRHVRAQGALLSILSPENQARLRRYEPLYIMGSDGGQWRIEVGCYSNTFMRIGPCSCQRHHEWRLYCTQPKVREGDGYGLPTGAVMLSQILMIMTNEVEYKRIAYT